MLLLKLPGLGSTIPEIHFIQYKINHLLIQ